MNTLRYHRQELIIGKKGQALVGTTTIAIVGLGALGSVSAELLTRAGIGKLILIDRDIVELTNLQRQVLYTEKDIDLPKATALEAHLNQINSTIKIASMPIDLTSKNIHALNDADIILDGTDNLYTRFLINEFCRKYKKSWIYAGAIKTTANLMVITPPQPHTPTPCFRCVFQEATGLDTCDTAGILNTTSMLIASMQVTEALKIILGKPTIQGLLSYDLWHQRLSIISVKKNSECPVCKGNYEYLESKNEPTTRTFCGGTHYQFYISPKNYNHYALVWKKFNVKKRHYGLMLEKVTLFKDGRVVVKASTLQQAKALRDKYMG